MRAASARARRRSTPVEEATQRSNYPSLKQITTVEPNPGKLGSPFAHESGGESCFFAI
jgi:hypothetical protein